MNRRSFLWGALCAPFVNHAGAVSARTGAASKTGVVSVSEFGNIANDIGAAINAAWVATKNRGYTLLIPAGTWPQLTPISIDTDDRGQSFRLEGVGTPNGANAWPDFETYQRGSVINAESLNGAAAITTNSSSGHRAAVALRNFSIVGGGVNVVNAGLGSHFDNIYVSGAAGNGFDFANVYGGRFDNLYASKCGGAGFYFSGCNANSAGTLISRENLGAYAIEIVQGKANSIGHLYIEANSGGALRWAGDVLSLDIGTIYAEDNNSGGVSDYEFRLGDASVSQSTARSCRVGSVFLNTPRFSFERARVGFENGMGVQLGLNSSDVQRVFEFSADDYRNGPLSFASSDFQNGTVDLTYGRVVSMINCHKTNTTTILPPLSGVFDKVGMLP